MIEVPIRSDALDYEDIISRIQGIFDQSSPIEQKQFIKILEELSDKGYSETLDTLYLVDFKEVPVSIDRFLCDPEYLGETNDYGNQIYPGWWDVYNDVFDSQKDIYEVVLSGATRIGKTSTAVSMMAYMTYLLMCYRNPQKYFGLKDVSRATIAFANLTKDLALGVAYREYHDTLIKSPWFMSHGTKNNSATRPIFIPEGNQIEIVAASDGAHVLGMQLFAALIDECNFSKAGVKDITKSKEHMKNLYDTANARITGTFKLGGHIYGKMFTCSSKNTDNDYLSDHIEKQLDAGNKHMYIFDKPQWEVLPSYRFGEGKFYITVGDRYKRGFVVPDENADEVHLKEYENEGYRVLEVPEDYKPNFRADYDIALRDIAGISVVGAMGFITQEMITPNISETRKNPFFMDYYEIGVQDNLTLEQYFHPEVVSTELRRLPMNIHIDFAEVSDHIGISGGVRDGDKLVFDLLTEKKISMPFFRQIFQVAIGAPRGDRMSFQKVINFIVWLKKSGFNIGIISTDQYQSSYVRENLAQQGFEVEKVSVDRTEDPYIGLRNLLQDQRIELIKHDLQEIEMINLQRINGVINHPPQSACFTGDTKIALLDGRILTIDELLIEQQYKTNWVYTINENTGLIEPKPILDVFQTKLTKDMVKVTLDNDEVIYCTPDHRFMLRDGSYEYAENLLPNDSLMPLYTKISNKGLKGYRLYYEPKTDSWHYEHRSFCSDPKMFGERTVVHHCNYNKLDNTPTNLSRVTQSRHKQIHNNNTVDYDKMAYSLHIWHMNNKNTDKYKKSKQQGVLNLIIRNRFIKTGQIISFDEAEAIHQDALKQKINALNRIHDIELLFNVDWDSLHGRIHNTLGARLTSCINAIEKEHSVDWKTLTDEDKVTYFNELELDRKDVEMQRLKNIFMQEISKRLNLLLRSYERKPRIKTISLFNADDIRIAWIEYFFGLDWRSSSFSDRCKASRRFSKLLETGEYIPLDEDLEYIPKKRHIIKSISLFGTDEDIKAKNVEEYCGVHMEDILPTKRGGYYRIYNNFCRGNISNKRKEAEAVRQRICNIEKIYGVSWASLSVSDKSRYSLKYHNLMNPEDKKLHYDAVAKSVSRHSWYTNGVDNKYILDGDVVPDGYYKGRIRSRASVEKGIITVMNRSDEEKARISKIHSEDSSNRIWVTDGHTDKYIRKGSQIPEGYSLGRSTVGKNHKVKSVERVIMPCRVYDLTIADNHNFALAAGVFVHNSSTTLPCLANGYNSKGIGKDCSDALCGWTATLISHADVVKPHTKPVLQAIANVNGARNYGYGGLNNNKPRYIPGFGQQYRKY